MKIKSRTAWLRVAALALAVMPVATLGAQQPRLTDVAKQEEQRRRTVAQPSKVYTNADLPTSRDSVPPVPAKEPPVVESTAASAVDDDTESGRPDSCQACERDPDGSIRRSEEAKHAFWRATGFPNGRPGWVVDHIIPLACGGADDPSNMQWQTRTEADTKDKIERIDCRRGDVIPTWQVQVPIIIGQPVALPPSCGVNSVREQAMSNYMRDAGFGGSATPLPPCPGTSP